MIRLFDEVSVRYPQSAGGTGHGPVARIRPGGGETSTGPSSFDAASLGHGAGAEPRIVGIQLSAGLKPAAAINSPVVLPAGDTMPPIPASHSGQE